MRYLFILFISIWIVFPIKAQEVSDFEKLLPVLTLPPKGKEILPANTAELEKIFNTAPGTLPRVFVKKLPSDFKEKGNKKLYAKIIGALILRENEQILSEQVLFNLLKQKNDNNIPWTKTEQQYFDNLVQKYDAVLLKTIPTQINNLFYKIDQIPVSLAIAQSALQTDWGTKNLNTPYAQKGWINNDKYDEVPYPDFISATNAYVLEMNATPNYEDFHRLRMESTSEKNQKSSLQIVQGLRTYMPEEVDYTDKVKSILTQHPFLFDFDEVILEK